MAPKPGVENVILRLTYCPEIDPNKPIISVVRQNSIQVGRRTRISDWFNRKLSQEKSLHPPGTEVLYTEWTILSGNQDLFNFGENLFDKAIIILGEESNHWVFFFTNRMLYMKGDGELSCSYCPCCIQEKYLDILHAIREHYVSWRIKRLKEQEQAQRIDI